jgi:hypothetical protein
MPTNGAIRGRLLPRINFDIFGRPLELKREAALYVARAVLGHLSPVITAKAMEIMAMLG